MNTTRIHVRYVSSSQPAATDELTLPVPHSQNQHMINVVNLARHAVENPDVEYALAAEVSHCPATDGEPLIDCERHWLAAFVPPNIKKHHSWPSSLREQERYEAAPDLRKSEELFQCTNAFGLFATAM